VLELALFNCAFIFEKEDTDQFEPLRVIERAFITMLAHGTFRANII
jgi:hypothetical protein